MAEFVRLHGAELGYGSTQLWRLFQGEFGEDAASSRDAFRQFARRIHYGGNVVPRPSQRVLTDEVLHIKTPDPLLITSDHHIPAHDADWLDFAFRLGEAFGCKGHAIPGDLGNFKSVASFDSQIYDNDESLEETLAKMDEFVYESCRRFGTTYISLGNHEHWLVRRLLQAKLAPERLKLFLAGDHPSVELTEFSYMVVNEDRAAGQPGVRLTHPRNFSRVPGSVGERLASKFLQHVIVAHDHQVGYRRDYSGQYTICHLGCCADPRRLDYVQTVDGTAPAMAQGFAIVERNAIYLFDKANCDQELWLWMAAKGRRPKAA
jgi:hypothetical protein